ncbi:MAG: hypothetical protein MI748_07195 [Opitutales bacterium]|nr:hypothetical protein [Opitutales bacterium]
MSRFIHKLLITIGIFMLTGMHLVVFQGVAWVNMYRDYRKTMSHEIALELTFSGQEVCGMCRAVENAKASMDDSYEQFLSKSSPLLLPGLHKAKNRSPELKLIGKIQEPSLDLPSICFTEDPPPPKYSA